MYKTQFLLFWEVWGMLWDSKTMKVTSKNQQQPATTNKTKGKTTETMKKQLKAEKHISLCVRSFGSRCWG